MTDFNLIDELCKYLQNFLQISLVILSKIIFRYQLTSTISSIIIFFGCKFERWKTWIDNFDMQKNKGHFKFRFWQENEMKMSWTSCFCSVEVFSSFSVRFPIETMMRLALLFLFLFLYERYKLLSFFSPFSLIFTRRCLCRVCVFLFFWQWSIYKMITSKSFATMTWLFLWKTQMSQSICRCCIFVIAFGMCWHRMSSNYPC